MHEPFVWTYDGGDRWDWPAPVRAAPNVAHEYEWPADPALTSINDAKPWLSIHEPGGVAHRINPGDQIAIDYDGTARPHKESLDARHD